MMQDQPDAHPPSESTVPAPIVEAMGHQVTQVARHLREYIEYQHELNEQLTRRVEKLERKLASRRKK